MSTLARADHGLAAQRAQAVVELAEAGTAVAITSAAQIRWATGFAGSHGAVLVGPGSVPVLFTDSRYTEQAAQQCPGVEVVTAPAAFAALLDRVVALRSAGEVDALGVQSDHLSVSQAQAITERQLPMSDLGPGLERLRMAKTADEQSALRRACEVSLAALDDVLGEIEIGMTEVGLARLLEFRMSRRGADDRSFETIVATGANSALPHHEPGSAKLRGGDLLVIDFGALVAGMHADCTRTFIVAAEPEPWQAQIYAATALAAESGRAAARDGSTLRDVDAAARTSLAESGWGENFVHGVGHGVGLAVHEAPMLAADGDVPLFPGVPLTVEPGVYLPGRGGVRIEDTVLVTSAACEVLTEYPRDLRRVG